MPINTAYYGAESSWVQFPADTSIDEFKKFYCASGNSVQDSTYGLASRTWISGLIANDYDNKYKNPLDLSFGWCRTDGNAPVDTCLSVTGFRTSTPGAHGRYATTQSGPSTMGLAMRGNGSPYVTNGYVQYFKSSSSGNMINASNAPHNYQPAGFNYRPNLYESSGFTYLYESNTVIAPALKFDFNRVYYVPFINYTLLREGYTIADWKAVTTPAGYSALVSSVSRRDLRSFIQLLTENPGYTDRIVIQGVKLAAVAFKFDSNGETTVANTTGGTVGTSRGGLMPMAYANTTTQLTFKDWYKDEAEADNYDVEIDIGFIKNSPRALSSCTIFNERTGTVTAATFTDSKYLPVAGSIPGHDTTGYVMPEGSCYYLSPVCLGGSEWTVKRFEDQAISSNEQRHAISIYAGLSDFGGLDAFREYCRKCAAYTGGLFSESYYPYWHEDLQDETCFIGTIDGGVTHGAYTHGTANATQPQAQWGDNWSEETPYKPTPGPGPAPDSEDPSDPLNLRERAHIGAELGPARYIVQPSDVVKLMSFINNCTDYNNAFEGFVDAVNDLPGANVDEYVNDYWVKTYPDPASWHAYVYDKMGEGVHPNNNIVGVMAFPFYCPGKFTTTDTGIRLGDVTTNYDSALFRLLSWATENTSLVDMHFSPHTLQQPFTAKRLTGDAMCVLDLGSYQIEGRFNDFRDYKPYSHIELQVPYHGTFELDPAFWVGHEVEVYAICEAVTGSSMAIVCRDEAPIFTSGGQMGTPVPLTVDTFGGTTASLAANSAQFQNMQTEHRVHAVNGSIDIGKSAAKTLAAGAFTVMTAGAGAGVLAYAAADTTQVSTKHYSQMNTESNNIKAAEYAIEHQQTGSAVLGSAAPSVNGKYETRCRLVFHYCRLNYGANFATYGATQGYSCNQSGNVGDFTGYTVFSNVVLNGIDATDEEKKMIVQEMQNGIII